MFDLLLSFCVCLCCFLKRDEGKLNSQLTEASQASALSCTDSESESSPADPQHADTPVLEAQASSIVPLGAADASAAPPELKETPSAPQHDAPKPFIPASDSFINSLVSDRDRTLTPQASITETAHEDGEEQPPAAILPTPPAAGHDVPWMNVDLEGAEAARTAQATVRASGDGLGTLESSQRIGEDDAPVWTWISGGGCDVDASSQISWLSPTGTETTGMWCFLNLLKVFC